MVLLVMMTPVLNANPVDLTTAREVGAKFLNGNTSLRIDNADNLQCIKVYCMDDGRAAFYVLNTTNGYVLVSADDCAHPILGYSETSPFDVNDVPDAMEFYLQGFVEQIQYGVTHRLEAEPAIAHEWELVKTTGQIKEIKGTSAVPPLITAQWGQGCYYNNMCPTDPAGNCGHVLVGCVAIAMGQIMRYWGYPTTGNGSHTYTPLDEHTYQPSGYPQQTANFGATTYQWNNMPNALYASSSTAQVNAVATLLWHCGVSVEMMYGVGGSGAFSIDVPNALQNYFRYSSDMQMIYRENYTDTQWMNLIKGSLNLSRPVYYSGSDTGGQGGHAFICDGYNNNDFLHFNWGWYGNWNDYYAIGALNASGFQFNNNNAAIINIHPILPSYQVTISPNPSNAGTVAFSNKGDRETVTYGFEDGTLMSWTSLDADGDGYGWVSSANPGQYHNSGVNLAGTGHESSQGYVISGSWSNSASIALTPDNFFISPAKAAYSQINFYACAQDATYAAEHFGIAVSTTGNTSASDFTTIQEWTLTAKDAGMESIGREGNAKSQGAWYNYNVDLSAYAGQPIWVAIRHFNCTDQFILNIDDVTLTTGGGGGGNSTSAFFDQGQSCTVTATPNSGYYFANWTENGNVVSSSATYTFTVNDARNLVANFTTEPLPQEFNITLSANPIQGGTVSFGAKDNREDIFCDFENGLPSDWTTIDADGDGYNWMLGSTSMGAGYGHNGSSDLILSQSYNNNIGALTPDNYLVSPQLILGGSITFWACAQDNAWAAEHFGVAVSTTNNNNANAFTTIQEWTMTAKENGGPRGMNAQGNWYEYTVDLSAYNGQTGYVAIRHFNCTDWFYLDVDDIMITEGSSGSTSAVYYEGQSCTVTATANTGYVFTNWTENGTVVSNSASYTFTVIGNRTLVANFTVPQPQQYTINVSANPANGGSASGGGTFNQGTSCTVTATANTGYTFTNWTENGNQVSTNANYTFTVTGNRNLVANFAQIPSYTIAVSANPSNGGTVTGGGTFTQGQNCTVTATANTGYTFTNWTENGNQVSTNANYTFTVTGNRTLVANFTVIPPQQHTITVSADPSNGGTVTGGGTYQQGAVCTLTASPNTGYQFVNWTKNGTVVSSSTSFSFNVSENATYVAHFILINYTVTVSASITEGGTVTGGGTYAYGSTVTVVVTPNTNYIFGSWTENGNVVSQEASYSFVVTGNRQLVAVLNDVTGVEESREMLSLYPNPANDKLFVESSQPIERCEVYSITGALLKRLDGEATRMELSVKSLPAGLYLLKLNTGNQVLTRRFIKE